MSWSHAAMCAFGAFCVFCIICIIIDALIRRRPWPIHGHSHPSYFSSARRVDPS